MPPLPQEKRQDDPLIYKKEFGCIAVIFRDIAGPFLLEKNKVQLQIDDIPCFTAIKTDHLHRWKWRGQLGK
jgi:hypothetical protein